MSPQNGEFFFSLFFVVPVLVHLFLDNLDFFLLLNKLLCQEVHLLLIMQIDFTDLLLPQHKGKLMGNLLDLFIIDRASFLARHFALLIAFSVLVGVGVCVLELWIFNLLLGK